MSKQTLITSRDPKGLHAVGLFEAVYNKAKLDDARAQRLKECGGELQGEIAKVITKLTTFNQFANEEVYSRFTYPKKYKGPKPIEVQIKTLAKIFGLDPSHAFKFTKNLPVFESFVPADALEWTGWFAIPSVDALGKKHFPEVTNPAKMYCRAVLFIHEKIAASRLFYNYCQGQIMPGRLQLSTRTAHAQNLITEMQKGDILIVAAQLGMHHRGKSVRWAREAFVANEFGLGSVAVGSIVLTHPKRLVRLDELDMDCAGDEFSRNINGPFGHAPNFSCPGGEVGFDADSLDDPSEDFGSVSAFLTQ